MNDIERRIDLVHMLLVEKAEKYKALHDKSVALRAEQLDAVSLLQRHEAFKIAAKLVEDYLIKR